MNENQARMSAHFQVLLQLVNEKELKMDKVLKEFTFLLERRGPFSSKMLNFITENAETLSIETCKYLLNFSVKRIQDLWNNEFSESFSQAKRLFFMMSNQLPSYDSILYIPSLFSKNSAHWLIEAFVDEIESKKRDLAHFLFPISKQTKKNFLSS